MSLESRRPDGVARFEPNVSGRSSCLKRQIIGYYDDNILRVQWLSLELAHRHVGRVERTNAFEVMFRVMMDDDVDIDLAPRVRSSGNSWNLPLHSYCGVILENSFVFVVNNRSVPRRWDCSSGCAFIFDHKVRFWARNRAPGAGNESHHMLFMYISPIVTLRVFMASDDVDVPSFFHQIAVRVMGMKGGMMLMLILG